MDIKAYQRLIEESDFKMQSSMQGVASADTIFNLKTILERLEFFDEFEEVSIEAEENSQEANLKLVYKGERYGYNLSIDDVLVNHLFNLSHQLTAIETERLQNARVGVFIRTHFNEDNLTSYHLQIKVLCCILPNLSSIIDHTSLSILSGKWAKLCAASNVPPPPSYLYRVHAVAGDNNDVWLHTHGLNRCGSIELEIVGASQENDSYRALSSIIETLAIKGVDNNFTEKELEPIFLGRNIVVTWKKWEDTIDDFDYIGCSYEDRVGHDAPTGVLFIYESEEDYKNKKISHVNQLVEHLQENPLFFISNQETDRMKRLASERIDYVYDNAFQKNIKILIKVGLEVDDEHKDEENGFNTEHLWFELVDITKDVFTGVLLNQPYYINKLNEEDQLQFTEVQITDWIIYTNEHTIYPDNVYLLRIDEDKSSVDFNKDKKGFITQLENWHEIDKHQEIIEACRNLKELDYDVSTLYCRALNNFGLYEEAVEEMLKFKSEGKNDYKWHYRLSYAYDSLEDYENALETIKESIRLKEDYASAWIQLAFIYHNTNRKKEALEALEEVFDLYNKDSSGISKDEIEYLHEMYENVKDSIESHRELELYNLLLDLKKEENYKEIKSILTDYEIEKYHFQLLKTEAYIMLKEFDEALYHLEKMNEEGGHHSTWLLYKYKALKGLKREVEANEVYQLHEEAKRIEEIYISIIETEDYVNLIFNTSKNKVAAISTVIEEEQEEFYMELFMWERVIFNYIKEKNPEILKYVKFELEGDQLCVLYFELNEENKLRVALVENLIKDFIENKRAAINYITTNLEEFGFK